MSPKLLDLGYEFFEFNSNCFECIPLLFFCRILQAIQTRKVVDICLFF